jgi:hypothetical protein
MLTINQLTMQRLTPRDRTAGDCFIKALTFCLQGKATYDEVEEVVMREQSHYNPFRKSSGVYGYRFLQEKRKFRGKTFTLTEPYFINDQTAVASMLGKCDLSCFVRAYTVGTYLITTRNHAFVVKDGEVFDGNTINWGVGIGYVWEVTENA